jgi:hypothetical protein
LRSTSIGCLPSTRGLAMADATRISAFFGVADGVLWHRTWFG